LAKRAAAQVESELVEADSNGVLCRSQRTLQGAVSPSEAPISASLQALREHPSRERGLGAAIERIRAIAIGRAFASSLPRILAGGVASFAVGLLPHLAPVARDALILQRAMPVAISTWSAGASVPLILGLAIGPTGA
jgi:hypothetical protein